MWLQLTFFPIEDDDELARLRALLSPFLRNVQKCGEIQSRNNNDHVDQIKKRLTVNAIINTASGTIELVDRLNRVMIRAESETINLEHNQLRAMNISSDFVMSVFNEFYLVLFNIMITSNGQLD